MKKVLVGTMMVLGLNAFSAQVLNNKFDNFYLNKEVKSLVFGNYNLDKELVVVSKVSGNGQESLTKAENDAKKGMEKAIKDYSYNLLRENLSGVLVTGPGFDKSKMKEFSTEIAEKLHENAVKIGTWTTSKKETVVLYTIDKKEVKTVTNTVFNERLDSVINKLNEYRDTFEKMNK